MLTALKLNKDGMNIISLVKIMKLLNEYFIEKVENIGRNLKLDGGDPCEVLEPISNIRRKEPR